MDLSQFDFLRRAVEALAVGASLALQASPRDPCDAPKGPKGDPFKARRSSRENLRTFPLAVTDAYRCPGHHVVSGFDRPARRRPWRPLPS